MISEVAIVIAISPSQTDVCIECDTDCSRTNDLANTSKESVAIGTAGLPNCFRFRRMNACRYPQTRDSNSHQELCSDGHINAGQEPACFIDKMEITFKNFVSMADLFPRFNVPR